MADEVELDESERAAEAGSNAGPSNKNASSMLPPLVISTQYVKDLSFESPESPDIYLNPIATPKVEVRVDVTAQKLGDDNQYETNLKIEAKARSDDRLIFFVDLTYSCLSKVGEVSPDHVQPLVLVEAPRLIFPFARAIVAGVTRDGGFKPLMINPIDFFELYRQRKVTHSTHA